jgi:hypothetical protein
VIILKTLAEEFLLTDPLEQHYSLLFRFPDSTNKEIKTLSTVQIDNFDLLAPTSRLFATDSSSPAILKSFYFPETYELNGFGVGWFSLDLFGNPEEHLGVLHT